jgi:hypothetical protein
VEGAGGSRIVNHLSSIVAKAFAGRIPVSDQTVQKYKEGFVDQNRWWGEWLANSQDSIAAGPVSDEVVPYLAADSYPRFLASALIDALETGRQESLQFVLAVGHVYRLCSEERMYDQTAVFETLSETESLVTLVCLSRLSSRFDSYNKQRSREKLLSYASWLASRCHEPRSKRAFIRMSRRWQV